MEVTAGEQKVRAGPGDAVYLQASLPHLLTNIGSTPLQAVSIACPPAL